MKLWVVKIGTNAILDAAGNFDAAVAKNLARGISFLKSQKIATILVSSGAVGAAKNLLNFCEWGKLKKIEAAQIKSAVGQPILLKKYAKIFRGENLVVAQCLLTRADFASRDRYRAVKNIFQKMIALGVVPIVNENDFLTPEELDFSDNDQLATFVAGLLSAEKMILLSNVDGFFSENPKNPTAKKFDEIAEILPAHEKCVAAEKSKNGLGGMASKLAAAKIAAKLGTEMILGNSRAENILQKIFRGDKIGTKFLPTAKKRASEKRVFLAAGAHERGKIVLDCPLENFLKKKKTGVSILGVGVKKIFGDFEKGDPVGIFSEKNKKLGAGLAKISAEKMRENRGKKGEIFFHADEIFWL